MTEMSKTSLNNGVAMPLIGLGTWNLQGQECIETVTTAISLGYRLFDTAHMYENEVEVGKAIALSKVPRSELFITTKLDQRSNSYDKAKKAIDKSLQKLGLDYLDLLLIHEPYPQSTEMYLALEESLKEGKTRAIGISNFDECLYSDFVKKVSVVPAVNQVEGHVYFQKWGFQRTMEIAGTKMQAWAPLAQGIDRIAEHSVLKEIGKKYKKSAAQIALRFLIQRGISVIPKTKHKNRLIENLEIFDFELSADEMETIRGLDRNNTLFAWTQAY